METEAPKERFFNGLGTSKGTDDATIIGIGLSGIVVLVVVVVVVVVGGENEVVEKEVDETEEEEAEDDDVLGLRACCLEQPQDGQNLFKGGFRCPERQTQCIFVTICLCSVFYFCARARRLDHCISNCLSSLLPVLCRFAVYLRLEFYKEF